MGTKGDRAAKEPIARQLYVDQGKTLEEISELLDVSRQTLSKWKSDCGDEWDQGRVRKRGRLERLRTMLDETLDAAEGVNPLKRGPIMDSVSKLGALVKSFEEMELAAQERSGAFKAELFSRFFRDLVEFFSLNDPAAAELVGNNFDDFMIFIRERYVS